MKNIILFICSLIPMLACAQGENDNWYLGYFAGINFSAVTPAALNDSHMDGFEACGTVSDSTGHLLFYTDGKKIWNRQHQVMQNGGALTGNASSQQLVIVKHPGNASQYYVFTTGLNDPASTTTVVYSIVDMSQGPPGTNGYPLGKVLDTCQNIPVLDNAGNTFRSEAITVVPSPYGTLWVLIPNGATLYSYVVNNSGLNNGNPVVSPISFPAPLVPPTHFGIRVSPRVSLGPDFSHYLCISSWGFQASILSRVFSFNDVTGKITSSYQLDIPGVNAYGAEFNKDGSVLFLGGNRIFAVDMLTSTSSSVNMMEIYNFGFNSTCGSIQRNKHNDIYVSQPNNDHLGRILNPDVYGPGISVDMSNVALGLNIYGTDALAKYGLPQAIELPVNTYYPCIGDLTLSNPEINNLFTYHVANTIKTDAAYTVFPKQDITMKAGWNITLLPNTYIMNGATYFAKIQRCDPFSRPGENEESIALPFNSKASAQQDDISVYPNPVSTLATISTKEKLQYWELYDMLGKLVLAGKDNTLKAAGLTRNTYLLKVVTESGKSSYKKITIR